MEANWKIGRLIGEGGFGKVFLLENEDNPDEKVKYIVHVLYNKIGLKK